MLRFAFLVFAALICMTGCTTKIVPEGPWVKKIDSEELSKIIISFSAKMKIDKHLELEDSWAAYDDYITRLCLEYSSQRLLTVYDARLLMVELVEELLYRLNNHSIVSFELSHFPFTANDLDVKINFESFYGLYLDQLYVGLAWLQAGCVHFYAFDRKNNRIDWNHDRFEPYTKSRELALIKREVDLPFTDVREAPFTSFGRFAGDRYIDPTIAR
ncbi:MAG: hypothetical protein LW832_00885 [Parachlamydia sp.]|jgi:hypothetical protein|nr:hypothetical protein [Parachlamydia sp.]